MLTRSLGRETLRRIAGNFLRQPIAVQLIRVIASIAVYVVELGLFPPSTASCRSVLGTSAASAPIQILVLADPQIITTHPHPSYRGAWAYVFYPLQSLFADRYLARAWRALKSPGGGVNDWTATVWLGDLTDTGRSYYIDQGLSKLYDRFFGIFPEEHTSSWNRTYYIPGNHDTSLKPHEGWKDRWEYQALQTREFSRWKFLRLFGTNVWDGGWDATPIYPPDSLSHTLYKENKQSKYITKLEHQSRRTFCARIPINTAHSDGSPPSKVAELILLDATDIVTLQRMHRSPWNTPGDGQVGAEADWRNGGSWWFVDAISKDRDPSIPRILFTHIPLYREPAKTPEACNLPNIATFPPGVMPAINPSITRQSASSLQMGTDAEGTYENLIGKEWSRFLMQKIQPNVIFSGDDHDHCHHLHQPVAGVTGGESWTIPELTVNAMSLTSGVRTPGYARLSIWQEPPTVGASRAETKVSYTPCALPRQVELWATVYPMLIAFTAILLPLHRVWLRRRERGRTGSVKKWLDGGEMGSAWDVEEHLPMRQRQSQASSNDWTEGEEGDVHNNGSGNGDRGGGGGGSRDAEEAAFLGVSRPRTFSRLPPYLSQWLRDFRDVAWVPALYWLLLMLLGF